MIPTSCQTAEMLIDQNLGELSPMALHFKKMTGEISRMIATLELHLKTALQNEKKSMAADIKSSIKDLEKAMVDITSVMNQAKYFKVK